MVDSVLGAGPDVVTVSGSPRHFHMCQNPITHVRSGVRASGPYELAVSAVLISRV